MAPASPACVSNIHWQPKQQIRLRVFIARLIPRQQVVVPVSVHSVSQLRHAGESQWEKSADRQREREVHGREEECWPREKQLLTLLSTFPFFFSCGWNCSDMSLVFQTVSSWARLSQPSVSGTDEHIISKRERWCEKEREWGRDRRGGGGECRWGAVFNKGKKGGGLLVGWRKRKWARIKASGSSTRVLSKRGSEVGGQQQCSSKTKEGHSLGRCQPTPPFVYSVIKRKSLPQELENFHKDLMRQTERK